MRRLTACVRLSVIVTLAATSMTLFVFLKQAGVYRARWATYMKALEDQLPVSRTNINTSRDSIVHKSLPEIRSSDINCRKLFAGDAKEVKKAAAFHITKKKPPPTDANYISINNCAQFIQNRQYITSSMTEEERTFPIAFSILMYKSIEQVERLLRAIYRPQNFYCIHVDQKSSSVIFDAMMMLSSCFDNVFVSTMRVNIKWGKYAVIEADLICMEELLKYQTWKYLINLTGMEFPLKTNGDLVRILRTLNGANDIQGYSKGKYYSVTHKFTPDEGQVDQSTLVLRFMEHATPVEQPVTVMPNQGQKSRV